MAVGSEAGCCSRLLQGVRLPVPGLCCIRDVCWVCGGEGKRSHTVMKLSSVWDRRGPESRVVKTTEARLPKSTADQPTYA